MDNGLVWMTIAILVLIGIVGVIAAFYDRTRSKQIERDLQDEQQRRGDEGRPR